MDENEELLKVALAMNSRLQKKIKEKDEVIKSIRVYKDALSLACIFLKQLGYLKESNRKHWVDLAKRVEVSQ